jgi:hypothetical protein
MATLTVEFLYGMTVLRVDGSAGGTWRLRTGMSSLLSSFRLQN